MSRQAIKIVHRASGTVLADGPVGWQGITAFEGNYYIHRHCLRAGSFKTNYIPGFCPYKFFYVWLDLALPGGACEKSLGWMYWLPNPLLPFIWYRVALPGNHPELQYEQYDPPSDRQAP